MKPSKHATKNGVFDKDGGTKYDRNQRLGALDFHLHHEHLIEQLCL